MMYVVITRINAYQTVKAIHRLLLIRYFSLKNMGKIDTIDPRRVDPEPYNKFRILGPISYPQGREEPTSRLKYYRLKPGLILR